MDLAKLKVYWDKLLTLLRVRAPLVGLEISDTLLRLVYSEGQQWKTGAVRLEAGAVEAGQVKNRELFVVALKELKKKVFGAKEGKRLNVIVSLGSANIYSQVFGLPIIEGENLQKAIQLNLQMVSPMEASQAYSGWQLVDEDRASLRLEVLSAFIERSAVDELNKALYEAGFFVAAIETRALALARVFRELGEGIDEQKAYILASVDNSGIDFLIIRKGQPYFDYFNPWKDIADENGRVSMEVFRATLSRNLHQVLNFYGQRWTESVSAIFLSTPALSEEITAVILENFSLPVRPLLLRADGAVATPELFIALGCFLRGQKPRSKDKELSLLGFTAAEEFQRERFLEFLRFWRLAMPATLGFLLALFFLSDLYLVQIRRTLESQLLFRLEAERVKESEVLQRRAGEFNKMVAMVESVRRGYLPRGGFIEKIGGLASLSGVSLARIVFESPAKPVTLSGKAPTQEGIVAFKKALEREQGFFGVDLPLTSIQSAGEGFSFSVSFNLRH